MLVMMFPKSNTLESVELELDGFFYFCFSADINSLIFFLKNAISCSVAWEKKGLWKGTGWGRTPGDVKQK